MLRVDRRGGGDGGSSGCNAMPPRPLEGDFLFTPLFFGLPTFRGDALFGAIFSLEQNEAPPPPQATAIVMPAALNGAISSFYPLNEEQRVLFFAEPLVRLHRWHCHEAARVEDDLSELDIMRRKKKWGIQERFDGVHGEKFEERR